MPTEQPTLEVKEPLQEIPKEEPKEPKEIPKEEPKPRVVFPPAPASAPTPAKKSEPAKIESGKRVSSPAGIQGIIHKAKGQATNAGAWIQSHPLQSGLIGAGV